MDITINDVVNSINLKFNELNPDMETQLEEIVDKYENGEYTKEDVTEQLNTLADSIDNDFVVEDDIFEQFDAKFDGFELEFREDEINLSLDLECVSGDVTVKLIETEE